MMNEHKVLIKTNGVVNQQTYKKDKGQDFNYYYVYYNSNAKNGMFDVYTNHKHFGESRLITQAKSVEEAIEIAKGINNSMRLFAGYYDNYPTLNDQFPRMQEGK
jgi:hypothetical protein